MKGVTRFNSASGMASLSKQLAGEDVTVKQDWKVLRVEKMTGEEGSLEVQEMNTVYQIDLLEGQFVQLHNLLLNFY